MNGKLPIAAFRDQILEATQNSPVVIITAETGAGKSTQVPQFLMEAGYRLVVTQPRRLAARTVATRVAQEMGEELGRTVGFRTAYERQDSAETRCMFCTDGLALVRELMGAGGHDILVLDEVHEWNLNIEVLVAWTKRQVAAGQKFRVVIMSATMEAEKLSAYFGGAPVIAVPGRLFPVEVRKPGESQAQDVAALLSQGRNVLWFQPGKTEIAAAISSLTKVGVAATVLPLHGELDSAEQDACFRRYSQPKCVVSTNVAQTSITIEDIDAVVDSGMERRIEMVDGVEGLYLKPISRADAAQRKGRAGRTKPGICIDHCLSTDRLDFPKAEILRSRLDQTVLRLAEAGIDMEELTFFHQPDISEIHQAKRALKALGCMDAEGRVTPIGKRVAKLPISVQYGRMVIEAERLGVVDDVITVAAILEQGEITARKIRLPDGRDVDAQQIWRQRFCPTEATSDILAQLAVWQGAQHLSGNEMRESGVFVKAFFQAKEKRRHLADALRGKIGSFGSSGKQEDILRAVCAGMVDHLWEYGRGGSYTNGDNRSRELGRESVIRDYTNWIVGLPFDLEVKTRRGSMVLGLIRMATKVDPAWLTEVAPQLVREEAGLSPRYHETQDTVVSTTRTYFNGRVVEERIVADPDHPEAATVFCAWLAGQMVI